MTGSLPADGAPPSSPFTVVLPDAQATEGLGRRVARICRPGDLIVLAGGLGAGKTTLTRGLGDELGVRGPITSPTFVVARRHPHLQGGTSLIHVDAYRIGSRAEIDDLDLLDQAEDAVTVVEWGADRVEHLSGDRLHIDLAESPQDPGARVAVITAVGNRWGPADLDSLAAAGGSDASA